MAATEAAVTEIETETPYPLQLVADIAEPVRRTSFHDRIAVDPVRGRPGGADASGADPVGLRSTLVDTAPLRSSPHFRRIWLGGIVSGFGSQMSLVAVMFQVWSSTGSPVWTGAVGLAQAVPIIAFGLLAGTLVDRSDRRRVYLLAASGQTGCAALLAVQGFTGGLPVGGLLALLAVQSAFGAGSGPAAGTFVPRLLPPAQVAAGLALNRIAFQGAMLVGPALGGVVTGWLGVGACYLLDALSFGVSLHAALRLPAMRPDGERARPGIRGVADGLAFLLRTGPVRGALLTDLATMVLSMPLSLFPLVNAERFGGDPRTLGLFLSAVATGGVLASVFSGTFTRLARPGAVMLAGSATWGVALALFGALPEPAVGLGAAGRGRRGRHRGRRLSGRGRAGAHPRRAARSRRRRRADRRARRPGRREHARRACCRPELGRPLADQRRPDLRRRGGGDRPGHAGVAAGPVRSPAEV